MSKISNSSNPNFWIEQNKIQKTDDSVLKLANANFKNLIVKVYRDKILIT